MKQTPIIEMDVHGLTVDKAIKRIEEVIKKANASTYRIRVIHGFNGGNHIQRGIYREIGHGLNPKVLRITGGENPGVTELVLREF
ncbi:MAG: hypothetical protein Q4E57_10740 [Eubacteriales bacterium]|nr:hypothetical protein [Eubacteriales bacterium]